MSHETISSRTFSMEDQLWFAELSGDWNPMHVDAVAARRTIYGDVVVHGVHVLVWSLDRLLSMRAKRGVLTHLRTDFRKQVHLGDDIQCEVTQLDGDRFALSVAGNRGVVALVTGSIISGESGTEISVPASGDRMACRDASSDELMDSRGALPLHLNSDALASAFPHLAKWLPAVQVAEIVATTRLVGMECPGLHSVYSSHEFRAHREGGAATLSYQITKADSRFSLLQLSVRGPTLEGSIGAFVRPKPVAQPSIAVVSGMVTPGEFRGERAIVVGGSRGLGEITAKVIAAGGGDVRISYHRGRSDATKLTEEIGAAGGSSDSFAYDVTDPDDSRLRRLASEWLPTQLYYFATPLISLERGPLFSPEKFERYCRFYLDGFARAVEALLPGHAKPLAIFYPSTVFLDEFHRYSTEYCAAKAAGELVCQHLQKSQPGVCVHAPRLPRMKTDSTSSLIPVRAADALEVMLPAVRAMRDSRIATA
jgi:acyl dehydratase/NAD(P)-dependent dehydrogenase (short-subunit alcohol dehydrogenase family)